MSHFVRLPAQRVEILEPLLELPVAFALAVD
jgi:hypothetical protein